MTLLTVVKQKMRTVFNVLTWLWIFPVSVFECVVHVVQTGSGWLALTTDTSDTTAAAGNHKLNSTPPVPDACVNHQVFDEVPFEILVLIFRNVDIGTQRRILSVCKAWKDALESDVVRQHCIVDQAFFIEHYGKKHPEDFKLIRKFLVAGSGNHAKASTATKEEIIALRRHTDTEENYFESVTFKALLSSRVRTLVMTSSLGIPETSGGHIHISTSVHRLLAKSSLLQDLRALCITNQCFLTRSMFPRLGCGKFYRMVFHNVKLVDTSVQFIPKGAEFRINTRGFHVRNYVFLNEVNGEALQTAFLDWVENRFAPFDEPTDNFFGEGRGVAVLTIKTKLGMDQKVLKNTLVRIPGRFATVKLFN